MEQIVLSVAAGVLGGNITGSIARSLSLGTAVNTLMGFVGGFAMAKLLPLDGGGEGFSLVLLVPIVLSGAFGGALSMATGGILRNMLSR